MDVDIEQPHLAHHHLAHQHPTRHWTDYAIPISALFVSMVSIFIAWQHGEVMKQLVAQNARLVQANSLPYMELSFSNGTPSGETQIRLFATNSGVGPAAIRAVQILVDGHPVSNPRELLEACCGGGKVKLATATLLGRMVRAGDAITYFDFGSGSSSKTDVAKKFYAAYAGGRIAVSTCYCSVFDDCWIQSTATSFEAPRPVKVCPKPARQYSY